MTEIRAGYRTPTDSDVLFKNTVDLVERQTFIAKATSQSIILSNLTNSALTGGISNSPITKGSSSESKMANERKGKHLNLNKYDENGRMYLVTDVRHAIFVSEFPEFKNFESEHVQMLI